MTSTAWQRTHNRSAVLREVIRRLDRTPAVWHDLAGLPGVGEAFDGEADLLRTLHLRWHTTLLAQLDQALDEVSLDAEAAIERAWADTTALHPGLRGALDLHRAHPALQRAQAMQLRTLAVTAGRATWDTQLQLAAAAGARMLERLNVGPDQPVRPRCRAHRLQHVLPLRRRHLQAA